MACPFLRLTANQRKCANGGQPELTGNPCDDGYARGHCVSFPAEQEWPDLIEITAASETPQSVVIRFSIEKDYLPVAIGENVFHWRTRKWRTPIKDEMIAAHMDAYVREFEILKNGVKE